MASKYIERAVDIISEDKKYSLVLSQREDGAIIGAASTHPIVDSLRIEHLGSTGGAGLACLKSVIKQSVKAGKGGVNVIDTNWFSSSMVCKNGLC